LKIKNVLILGALALLTIGRVSFAEFVEPEKAKQAALTQSLIVKQHLTDANTLSMNYTLSNDEAKPLYSDKGQILAYVFDLKPEGFIVVTANTDLVPVIAYSNLSSFPWDEDPQNLLLHMLRSDLSLRIAALKDNVLSPKDISRHNQLWTNYLLAKETLLAPGDSWPPDGQSWTGGWVKSQWHQRSPYNNKCPIDPTTNNRCVVGCVATAMGQILNFWQYPDSVIFTHASDYTTTRRNINIDATTATIHNIDYHNGSPVPTVCADISYACGVSVKMDYSSTGSGANHSNCANGYRNDFDFSTAEWKHAMATDFYTVLEQNMKDSMPAQLGISKPNAGHSIVCDGFREPAGGGDNEWHLNFGWGSGNPDPLRSSWYVLPNHMPADYTTVDDGVVNIKAPRRPSELPAAPVAAFSGTPTSGTAPLNVTFTDESTGSPTSWSWSFGDGLSSSTQSPTHRYDTAGLYSVTLIVTNADGADTLTKTDYIDTRGAGGPTAAFSGTPTSGTAPLSVTFTDQSTGSPTSWNWTFGDGTTSTTQSPTHIYSNSGTYNVVLIVSNASGTDTLTRNGYITVTGGGPTAAFSATPTSGNAPLNVTFTDQSTGTPTSWNWNFGDGNNATTQNPTHTYSTAGTYNVVLIVSNASGADTLTRTGYITVNAPLNPPVAAFTASPKIGYVPITHRMQVTFTDNSTNTPTSWNWDFDLDHAGTATSTDQNPTHTYTSAGTFRVQLIATNTDGADTTTDTIRLVIKPADYTTTVATLTSMMRKKIEIEYGTPQTAKVELAVYDINGCLVRKLLSQEISAGNYSIMWNMKDDAGREVPPGVYFVKMQAPKGHSTTKFILTR